MSRCFCCTSCPWNRKESVPLTGKSQVEGSELRRLRKLGAFLRPRCIPGSTVGGARHLQIRLIDQNEVPQCWMVLLLFCQEAILQILSILLLDLAEAVILCGNAACCRVLVVGEIAHARDHLQIICTRFIQEVRVVKLRIVAIEPNRIGTWHVKLQPRNGPEFMSLHALLSRLVNA